jgi:hypothetical protein
MINPELLDAYFLDLATRLKTVRHTSDNPKFFYNIDHIKRKKADTDLSSPVMVLDEIKGTNSYNGAFRSQNNHGFWILKQVELDDWAGESTAVAACLEAANQVLTKMIFDFANEELSVMAYLDPDSITFEETGPELDQLFGVYIGYRTSTVLPTVYSAEDYDS